MKKISFIIITIILTLGLSFSLQSLLASWTAPTAVAPANNTATPLNTSNTGQSKNAGLIINAGSISENGLIVQGGKTGLGTLVPNEALSINGVVSMTENLTSPATTPGFGKIFSKYVSFGASSDVNDKLLLHMDGAGATFVDSSAVPKTVIANGGASKSTSVYKFGGSSGHFNDSYLTVTDSDDWNFTNSSGTIDFWVYFTTMTNTYFIGQSAAVNDSNWVIYTYAGGNIGISRSGVNEIVSSAGQVTAGTWYHIAVVKNGNTTTIYKNGVAVASGSTAVWTDSPTDLRIGGGTTGWPTKFNGYIDELRISKGVARWTADFVPYTASYGATTTESALFYRDGAGNEHKLAFDNAAPAGNVVISLVGGAHTSDDCSAKGTNWTDGGGNHFCKIAGSSCPTGWTAYDGWSSGIGKTCGYSNPSGWPCPTTACSAPGYNFTNVPPGGCSIQNGDNQTIYENGEQTWRCLSSGCGATITEVGCNKISIKYAKL